MDVSLFIFALDLPSKVDVGLPSTSTSESASILIFQSASISNFEMDGYFVLCINGDGIVTVQDDCASGRICNVTLPFHHQALWYNRWVVRLFVLFELPPVPDFPWNKLPSTNGRFNIISECHHDLVSFSGMNTNPLFVVTLSLCTCVRRSTRIHEVCIGPVCQFILTWRGLTFRVLVVDNHGLLCMSDRQRYIRAWKVGIEDGSAVKNSGNCHPYRLRGLFPVDIGADAIFTWIPIPVWIAVWTSMIPPTVRMRQRFPGVMKLDAALSLCCLRWKGVKFNPWYVGARFRPLDSGNGKQSQWRPAKAALSPMCFVRLRYRGLAVIGLVVHRMVRTSLLVGQVSASRHRARIVPRRMSAWSSSRPVASRIQGSVRRSRAIPILAGAVVWIWSWFPRTGIRIPASISFPDWQELALPPCL